MLVRRYCENPKNKLFKPVLTKHMIIFSKTKTESERLTTSSYEVAKLIAVNKKPFTDGEFRKDCMMAVLYFYLFLHLDNKQTH